MAAGLNQTKQNNQFRFHQLINSIQIEDIQSNWLIKIDSKAGIWLIVLLISQQIIITVLDCTNISYFKTILQVKHNGKSTEGIIYSWSSKDRLIWRKHGAVTYNLI